MKKRTKQPEKSDDPNREIAMTLQDVADYLNCHYTTVYRLVRQSGLPVFHVGSDYRVRRADLEKWIARQHVRPRESTPSRRGRKRKS
jgi:excisionase family DNA binding protein